jgi:hypothetical protein
MNETVEESHYDPFPDNYTAYPLTENYQTDYNIRTYYISPQSIENIPIKKTLTVSQIPQHAFVSVAGYTMNFNISLGICSTSNCTNERAEDVQLNQLYTESLPVPYSSNQASNVPNVSVFVGIGVGLAMLGACTFGMIYGMRKIKEAP